MIWPDDFINKIICGDCLEVMKEIPDESIDIVFADPPFNVGLNYGEKFNDRKSGKIYWDWIRERIVETFRILRQGTRLYVFHSDKGIFKLKPICEKAGFVFHQTLIWHKPNLLGGPGRIMGDWHYTHEFILLFHKGKRTPMQSTQFAKNCFSVFIYATPQTNFKEGRDHPAQKPLKLMEHLISRTPGQLILFPFLGSGIDTRAAKNLGRDFIGIEISEKYCAVAEERLAQGVL